MFDKDGIICSTNERVIFTKFSLITMRHLKTINKKMKETGGTNDGIDVIADRFLDSLIPDSWKTIWLLYIKKCLANGSYLTKKQDFEWETVWLSRES